MASKLAPKSGYVLRAAESADARALYDFGKVLLAETNYFLRGPSERARSVDEMRLIIERFQELPRHLLLSAWLDGQPVGEAVVMGGELERNKYTATVGVGVLQAHTGNGLGRKLMEGLEFFAQQADLHRLELTVMSNNERAQQLYGSMNYVTEGVRIHSLYIDGAYVDEIVMAKLLSTGPEA
ncbi:MAG: GNAT family N-acetyltransferase [Proteobacteria bacterium]|nr:GNAT family N-acetyltransferase [Pseudomonadota bacterium]